MTALEKYCTAKELVRKLKEKTGYGCERTLAKWREQRIGPPWIKFGKTILYPDDGIEEWLRSQVQRPVRSRRAA